MRISIVAAYFQAGLEKIITGGSDWLSPESLISYMSMFSTDEGVWLMEYPALLYAIPVLVVCFQMGFILVLFYPRITWFFLIGGCIFHTSTGVFLGVGSLFHPWIATYLFFLPPAASKKLLRMTKAAIPYISKLDQLKN